MLNPFMKFTVCLLVASILYAPFNNSQAFGKTLIKTSKKIITTENLDEKKEIISENNKWSDEKKYAKLSESEVSKYIEKENCVDYVAAGDSDSVNVAAWLALIAIVVGLAALGGSLGLH